MRPSERAAPPSPRCRPLSSNLTGPVTPVIRANPDDSDRRMVQGSPYGGMGRTWTAGQGIAVGGRGGGGGGGAGARGGGGGASSASLRRPAADGPPGGPPPHPKRRPDFAS